jgi:hypothetical protein
MELPPSDKRPVSNQKMLSSFRSRPDQRTFPLRRSTKQKQSSFHFAIDSGVISSSMCF